jgi:hypothetical protein
MPTVPNDSFNPEGTILMGLDGTWMMTFSEAGFIFGAVVFGACHYIAWDFDFPTSIEQTFWRAACFFTAAAIPLHYLCWYALSLFGLVRKFPLLLTLTCITYVLYTVCRLYIVVEVFRSLFYLPPDAFVATWSSAILHAD